MSDEDSQPVVPYLTVAGADKALAFYARVFDAEERGRMMAEDGRRIMHACFAINGGLVYVSDEFPEFENATAPQAGTTPPVAIALRFASPAEVNTRFAGAIEAGASAEMAPMDAFWGDRFATIRDPFGHRWMLTAPLKG